MSAELVRRAAVHAALGEPARLAIADALLTGDASPSELQVLVGIPSNLLAHHVGVLERAGVLHRSRSEGDRRRTYLGLVPAALDAMHPPPAAAPQARRVVFVCTENSARSPLAAALWTRHTSMPSTSAGTRPAARVHPGTVAAARRHALRLATTRPRRLADVARPGDLVITVCDSAHEELGADPWRPHWSIPDPVRPGDAGAFDRTLAELTDRIARFPEVDHD